MSPVVVPSDLLTNVIAKTSPDVGAQLQELVVATPESASPRSRPTAKWPAPAPVIGKLRAAATRPARSKPEAGALAAPAVG